MHSLPLPLMIPPILARPLGLHPPVLDGEQILEHALLDHRLAEQLAAVADARAQLLARVPHRLPHALQLELARTAPLRLVQLPRAVDCPVPEVAGAREAEGPRGLGVPEEVADEGCFFEALAEKKKDCCCCCC